MIGRILYFDSPGKINTEDTLKAARGRAEELKINQIVLASTHGNTAKLAVEIFKGLKVDIIAVSICASFDENDWTMTNEERKELLRKLGQRLPAVMAAEAALGDAVFRDGALSTKVKRLIALGIALRGAITNCILAQTEHAIEAGANRDEILETLSVAVGMSGVTGIAESLRVVKVLDELGEL